MTFTCLNSRLMVLKLSNREVITMKQMIQDHPPDGGFSGLLHHLYDRLNGNTIVVKDSALVERLLRLRK